MGRIKNLTGQRFGRLTVIKEYGRDKSRQVLWLCRCDCGNEIIVRGIPLRKGTSTSCGCYQKEQTSKNLSQINTRHGKHKTRIYRIWINMKQRCFNPDAPNFKHYGGRGITVCDEWVQDFQTFYKWAIENGYKDNLTIDRKDTNGNYEPANCQWITQKQQNSNTRRTIKITHNGETHTMKEWSEKTGINYDTLKNRIKKGNPVEKALTMPIDETRRNRK